MKITSLKSKVHARPQTAVLRTVSSAKSLSTVPNDKALGGRLN